MQDETVYRLALSLVPGIGGHTFKQLISYIGSAKDVLEANPSKIQRIPGIGLQTYYLLRENASTQKAEKVIRACEKQDIRILFHSDKDFPRRLNAIHDAPAVIYTSGNMNLNPDKAVSIVGTRNASRYGMQVTEELVEALKVHKASIVSGMAYGIDICAHKAAMKENLETIGVLAGGLDKIYPAVHKRQAAKMLDCGGIISEHPPGIIPDAPKFPARNRIIAALSDATIVVEAAEKGGALITAELANGYNKDVFAVPGNVHSQYSKGCNNLIRDNKAILLTSISDLEYYLNWDLESSEKEKKSIDLQSLRQEEQVIIRGLLDKPSLIIDEISWQTQIPVHKLAGILLELEFRGLVHSLPGKKFALAEVYR
jgi:DNA processing protein